MFVSEGAPNRMGIRSSAAITMLFAAMLVARAAAAQDSTQVRLTGAVRDIGTESPVEGAAVKILELGWIAVTDRTGFFAFDSLPQGTWTFETSQFGYETNTEASDIGRGNFLLVRLQAKPIELEGLYVSVVQQLVKRRMAVPSRVLAWEKQDLEEAISPDVGSFVRSRGVAEFVRCGGEFGPNDLPNCFLSPGRPVRLRVFLDDIEVPPGIGTHDLGAYDPRDLWAVEFLPGCRQLRIYTAQFMDLVETGRVRLHPSICGP